MHERPYFAYGSNLDARDRLAWCAARGADDFLARPLAEALLPDFELAFHYDSHTRGGGALDVRPRRGRVVAGVLFEVAPGGWAWLDQKEGRPACYERREVTALLPDGRAVEAVTYTVVPGRVEACHIPPTEAYAAAVRRGLEAFALPRAPFEAAAAGHEAAPLVEEVFAYGTLMRGEERHGVLLDRLRALVPATGPGRLFDLGAFPALVVDGHAAAPPVSGGRVRGELHAFSDLEGSLGLLDAIEGFEGYGALGSLYERVLVRAAPAGGTPRLAWTYAMRRPIEGARPIPEGCWRAARRRAAPRQHPRAG